MKKYKFIGGGSINMLSVSAPFVSLEISPEDILFKCRLLNWSYQFNHIEIERLEVYPIFLFATYRLVIVPKNTNTSEVFFYGPIWRYWKIKSILMEFGWTK